MSSPNSAAIGLDLSPNIVNPLLSGFGGDSDLFPVSASWLDVLHAKGQMSRMSFPWLRRFLEARLASGEEPQELACWCGAMLFSGNPHAPRAFSILLELAPQAASIICSPSSAPFFSKLASLFGQASMDWAAPQDMSLRGWSKGYSDRQIQSLTRQLYAQIGDSCSRVSAIGMPAALQSLISEDQASGRALPGGQFGEAGLSCRNMAQRALTFLSLALASMPDKPPLWMQRREAVAAAAIIHGGPKSFKRIATLLADSSHDHLFLSGQALALALARSQRGIVDNDASPRLAAAARTRGLDLMHYFCHWSMPNRSAADAFFAGLFGGPFGEGFAARLDQLAFACGDPSKQLSVLGLALAAHANGADLGASEQTRSSIWQGHIDFGAPASKPSAPSLNGSTYAHNHMALAASFPHAPSSAQSLLAAAPAQAAEIERCMLDAWTPAFSSNRSIAAESLSDHSSALDEPEQPKPRAKLRL